MKHVLILATALVAAAAAGAVRVDRAWGAGELRAMVDGATAVRVLGTGERVGAERLDEAAAWAARGMNGAEPARVAVTEAGALTWFERAWTGGFADQGVLLTDRKTGVARLLEWNVTLPAPVSRAAAETRDVEAAVMSFNIRYGTANDGSNSWPYREEIVYDLLQRYDADLVGLQEALKFQIDSLLANVPGYAYVGVGRDDGEEAGEYSAIMYKTSRLAVAESGTFWFCNQPNVPGCTSYGNSLPRIATWGRFVDRVTGQAFYMYNCHLDHQSENSRQQSVVQMLDDISKRVPAGMPVLVTGDFNAAESSVAVTNMKASGFDDTFRLINPNATNVGTTNDWNGQMGGAKIDYVFAPDTGVRTTEAAIIYDNVDGRYPSDHYPVWARLLMLLA